MMSRAFIVASTSAGLVAPGRAPRARPRGPDPVALQPIGRSPAYAPSLKKKEDDVGGSKNKPGVARLFGGGNSDMKAKVAPLEYELEHERLLEESARVRTENKRNEETQRGFDTGMAVAKKQIKSLEELLEEEKKKNQ